MLEKYLRHTGEVPHFVNFLSSTLPVQIKKKKLSLHTGSICRCSVTEFTYSMRMHQLHMLHSSHCATKPDISHKGFSLLFSLSSEQNSFITSSADGVKVPVGRTRWNLELVNSSGDVSSLKVSRMLSSYHPIL